MMLKLTLLCAVVSIFCQSTHGSPQVQYRYGVPSLAPAPSFPAARAPPPHPEPPLAPPLAPPVPPGASLQEDDALELLPPLQHVVGTKFPAVSPGRGYKFPLSQLLNPTPPPNLKH